MLTKEDKKDIRKIFCEATNEVIMPAVEKIVEKKVREEFDRYEKKDLVRQDKLMKELKDIREEHAADAINISGINDRYMDHEKRLVVLEEKTA